MELDGYSFVLLKRGPRAFDFSDEELDRLQEQHLAHLGAMHEQGHLLLAGPFSDQADETLRGFCLYRTSVHETRRLAESDPSVQAGRMAVDVMGWWTKEGIPPVLTAFSDQPPRLPFTLSGFPIPLTDAAASAPVRLVTPSFR
jgi:uncharacterized protein YciI